MDKIKVIEQTTAEREQETRELFEQIKELIDEGSSFLEAVQTVKNIPHHGFLRQAWYKELKAYAKTRGYTPKR